MAENKKVLGRINCPSCGENDGMRVTLDKNGAPFGYCDANCEVQLRLGGNQLRVKAFLNKHPHIKAAYESEKNPVSVPVIEQPKPVVKLADLPVNEEKKPKPKAAFSMENI